MAGARSNYMNVKQVMDALEEGEVQVIPARQVINDPRGTYADRTVFHPLTSSRSS